MVHQLHTDSSGAAPMSETVAISWKQLSSETMSYGNWTISRTSADLIMRRNRSRFQWSWIPSTALQISFSFLDIEFSSSLWWSVCTGAIHNTTGLSVVLIVSSSSSIHEVLDCLDDIDTTPAFQTIATAIRAMADQMAKDYRDVMLNVDSLNRASGELLKRTEPQSSCVFCTLAENQDNHSTMRCSRYADSVSRITQAAKIGLCVKCLKTAHERECGVKCSFCGMLHNSVLCQNRGRNYNQSFKKRKQQ